MPQGPHRAAYRDRSMSNNTPPKVVGERAVLRGCCLGCRFYIISGTTLWCSLRLRWWWHVWRWHLWRSLVRRWSLVRRCIYVPRWRWLLHGWRLDSCHCIVRIHGKARLREWWLFRPGRLSPWWPVSERILGLYKFETTKQLQEAVQPFRQQQLIAHRLDTQPASPSP